MNRAVSTLAWLTLAVSGAACRSDPSTEPRPGAVVQDTPTSARAPSSESEPEPAPEEKNARSPVAAGDEACQGAVACFEAARAAEQAGAREAALLLYERACDADGAQACARLGHMHLLGQGTEVDEARGLDYLRRACRLGSPGACDALGH
ncbi:MAG: hypothetical protein PVI30_01080 [Myxococcales bacterium]|jgi:TPR repeat protein